MSRIILIVSNKIVKLQYSIKWLPYTYNINHAWKMIQCKMASGRTPFLHQMSHIQIDFLVVIFQFASIIVSSFNSQPSLTISVVCDCPISSFHHCQRFACHFQRFTFYDSLEFRSVLSLTMNRYVKCTHCLNHMSSTGINFYSIVSIIRFNACEVIIQHRINWRGDESESEIVIFEVFLFLLAGEFTTHNPNEMNSTRTFICRVSLSSCVCIAYTIGRAPENAGMFAWYYANIQLEMENCRV